MPKFCTNCGKELSPENIFCSGCGTKVPHEDDPQESRSTGSEQANNDNSPLIDGDTVLVNVVEACEECDGEPALEDQHSESSQNPQTWSTRANSYTPPAYTQPIQEQSTYQQPYAAPQVSDDANNVVSTGAFFGFEFLFALPFIGWIICLIVAFAPKNKNLKNFARAKLIWLIIGIVLSIVLTAVAFVLGNIAIQYIETSLTNAMNSFASDAMPYSTPGAGYGLGWLEELLSGIGY